MRCPPICLNKLTVFQTQSLSSTLVWKIWSYFSAAIMNLMFNHLTRRTLHKVTFKAYGQPYEISYLSGGTWESFFPFQLLALNTVTWWWTHWISIYYLLPDILCNFITNIWTITIWMKLSWAQLTAWYMYYKPSLVVTVVYDVTKAHSLAATWSSIQHILDGWVSIICCLQVAHHL